MGIVGNILRAALPADLAPEAQALSREVKRRLLWWLRRGVTGADRRVRETYLHGHAEPKLHIGCAGHLLDGWLNTDHFPALPAVVHLDATQPFPFADATFTCIYSEHMIEHIPHAQGGAMLRECRRVLRPDGSIRLATPDLRFLLALGGDVLTEAQQRYLAWSAQQFLPAESGMTAAPVINHYCHGFGHRFIYDEPTLRQALVQAGFTAISRMEIGQSQVPALCGLEHTARLPQGFLQLETMVLEARPAGQR
jgi:predicted SAM-dependent methyltransferase